jgi:hypothetical protein
MTPSCKECLAACWGLAIREGTIGSVSCPSVECTKLRNTHRPGPPLVPPLDPSLGPPPGPSLGSPHVDENQGEEKEMKDEIDRIERTVDLALLEEVVGKEGRVRFEWLVRKRRVENGQFLPRSRPFAHLMSHMSCVICLSSLLSTSLQIQATRHVRKNIVKLPSPPLLPPERNLLSAPPIRGNTSFDWDLPGNPSWRKSRKRSGRRGGRGRRTSGRGIGFVGIVGFLFVGIA